VSEDHIGVAVEAEEAVVAEFDLGPGLRFGEKAVSGEERQVHGSRGPVHITGGFIGYPAFNAAYSWRVVAVRVKHGK